MSHTKSAPAASTEQSCAVRPVAWSGFGLRLGLGFGFGFGFGLGLGLGLGLA